MLRHDCRVVPRRYFRTVFGIVLRATRENRETQKIPIAAELTAVELVQYEQYLGGLSNIATVIAELLESTDFAFASEGAFRVCKYSSVQRFGYIVEKVIGDERQGEIIYHEWVRSCPRLHYQKLSLRSNRAVTHRDERWKIDVNTTIELDEI